MIKNGIGVNLITDKTVNQPYFEILNKIKIYRMNHFFLALLLGKRQLVKTILKNNPNVILLFGSALSALYIPQLKKMRKPIVWYIDSDVYTLNFFKNISFREFFSFHHRFFWNILLSAVCPKFIIRKVALFDCISKIIVFSQYLKKSLRKIGVPTKKITVIQPTINVVNAKIWQKRNKTNMLREKLGFQRKDFIILYLGSPCTLRGTDVLIRSLPKILKKSQNITAVILSRRNLFRRDWEDEHLEKEEKYLIKLIKKMRVNEYVRIISGILHKCELKNFIYVSNVVALPFKVLFSEVPISILETMNIGKVVITTNIGTISEIISDDRGILIEPNDANALAKAFLYVMDHPRECEQLGNNAREFASNLPYWDRIALKTIAMLKEATA